MQLKQDVKAAVMVFLEFIRSVLKLQLWQQKHTWLLQILHHT